MSVSMPYIYLTLANVCIIEYCLLDERPLVRTISVDSGSRTQSFREAVRGRDQQCVISGRAVINFNGISSYTGFNAARVFPLAYENHWREHGYSHWITVEPPRGGKINSVQNGLLLSNEIHALFDTYSLSIDPDVRISNLYQVLGLTMI